MENLIAAAAFSIMGIGLITSILGVIEFTRCFDNSPQDPPQAVAAPEAGRSTGH